MTHESLLNRDWDRIVQWLGGAQALERSARETRAFRQAREIKSAVDLLASDLGLLPGRARFQVDDGLGRVMGAGGQSAQPLLYSFCGNLAIG